MFNPVMWAQRVSKLDVQLSTKAVSLALISHATADGAYWMGRQKLADDMGLSIRLIRRAVAELESRNMLRRTHHIIYLTNGPEIQ